MGLLGPRILSSTHCSYHWALSVLNPLFPRSSLGPVNTTAILDVGDFHVTLPDFTDTSIRGRMMKWEVSMATPTRRQCTDAFKSEAVRLTRASGRPVAQVARELGIGDNLLYRWRSEQHHV